MEDDPIIGNDLKETLQTQNFEVAGICRNYHEALEAFQVVKPEVILVDIKLKGSKDGIDFSETINFPKPICPVIYLTGSTDKETKARAFRSNPSGFLTKPFYAETVIASVELAVEKFNREKSDNQHAFADIDLFVKNGDQLFRVNTKDIQCFKAEGSYCRVFTEENEFLISGNLKIYAEKLQQNFTRIHRSYLISNSKITSMNSSQIFLGNRSFPIGRAYKHLVRKLRT